MRVLLMTPERIAVRTRYKIRRDEILAANKRWREANSDKFKACKRRHYLKNRQKYDLQSDLWKEINRDRYLAYSKASTARKRASKLRATPKWLTPAQKSELKQIYLFCPPGHEVDHEIPLQGKNVSGLHVPWNLQYLPMSMNRSKGNKHEGL